MQNNKEQFKEQKVKAASYSFNLSPAASDHISVFNCAPDHETPAAAAG